MPTTRCCCCFDLRTGTMWIAWANLACCVFSMMVFSVALFTGVEAGEEGVKRWYEQSRQGMVAAYAIQASWLFSVVCLLAGVYLERPRWLLPWVGVTVVNVGAFVGIGVYEMTLGNHSPLVCALSAGVLMLYCSHIVWCRYLEAADGVGGVGKTGGDGSETDSDVV